MVEGQDIPLQFPAPPLDVLHQYLGSHPTTVRSFSMPFVSAWLKTGHIIEIDESKFGKRKYNRGRRVVGKWILWGFCRTTDECFLVEFPNNRMDHHTLVVNHSRGFVDPLTGVYTNTCDVVPRNETHAPWKDPEALEIALCEFILRKRHNLTRSDSSVRRAFNSKIPKLMQRVLS